MNLKLLGRFGAKIGLLSSLSACAVNPQVPMKEEFWTQKDRSVGVAIAKLPDTMPHMTGRQGLLDFAINNAMADELGKALKEITLTDSYGRTRSEVVNRMREKGMKASVIDRSIDAATLERFSTDDKSRVYASKDFRPLKAELGGIDRLIVFTVTSVGTQRSYFGFIPTGAPIAILDARGEIIDLQTNEVLWRQTVQNSSPIDDPWDQSPDFKNVHAAVQKVIGAARQAMIARLFDSPPSGAAAGK